MDNPDKPFSELVNIMRSWIPRLSEPPNVSRDFWMPDHSCRVCYECDSQFTIFNRRHHCRLCGRIFCGKCTTNAIPVLYDYNKNAQEEVERIRVCNFCFKQWKQDIAQADNSTKQCLSASISMTSFMSTKSGETVNNNASVVGSYLVGPHKSIQYGSSPSLKQSPEMGACFEKSDAHSSRRNMNSVPNTRDQQYNYGMNRSDDDDEYGIYRDSEEQSFHPSDGYYDQTEYEEAVQGYHSNNMYLAEESISSKETCTPEHTNTNPHPSMGDNKMEGEMETDNDYECDAASPLYGTENADAEPVDFENNGLIWLPPDPEDEQDEQESFDDEDDDNVVGEWAYDRSSNSFGNGEFRGRDRSFEENKKAMKTVVDGHFKALISQLLQVEKLSQGEENDKKNWLEIVTSLSWEAATLLKPDTSKGGGMDPGGYVKIKCLPCGHSSESKIVKGVVCKKNVAHKHMTSQFEKPRFLILGGALEYQRVTNLLSSFDTLLRQEMDHLKMAVARIAAHKPNVLLVEKSVSRFAQECLLTKGISLVLNIKRPLLERIARCTGAQIVPSIDHLSSPKIGRCDLFHVDKFSEEYVGTGKTRKRTTKTLMFFEDCPKPLGCTVLLKGASLDELKKVKHVVQYGVFAAYHLALETSFLADEGASLPELPLRSPITVALPDKPSITDRSISVVPGFTHHDGRVNQIVVDAQRSNTEDLNFSWRYGAIVTEAPHGDSKFLAPSSGTKVSSMGKNNHDDHITIASNKTHLSTISGVLPNPCSHSRSIKKSKVCFGEFYETTAYIPNNADPNHSAHPTCDSFETSEKGNVVAAKINDNSMVEKQTPYSNMDMSHHNVNDGNDHPTLKEGFASSSDHQSILVSISTRSVWKGTVCERSQLFRIKYYGNFDKPLGRFLRDHLFDQSFKCRTCDSPSEAHVHSYTHHQGSLTISVRNLQDFSLPGERDGRIWMWHRCLLCPRRNGFPPATRRVVMSDAAWGLSFGKFLELSFSNHASASRVASCGHSLHRDCPRFYGYANMVACFRYSAIDVFSVYLPPPKVDFDYQQQEWIQKEANEVSGRAKFLFSQLRAALFQFIERTQNGRFEVLELRKHVIELEELLQKEKLEFEDSLNKLLKRERLKGQQVIDILEVNKLRRQIVFHTYVWYQRMSLLFESDFCPKELFNTFLAREKEIVYSSEKDFHSPNDVPGNANGNELLKDDVHVISCMDNLVDHGLVRGDAELGHMAKEHKTTLYTSTSASEQSISLESGLVGRRTLSDGQVPVVASLSDTFDAKWTGDNTPVMADLSMIDPLEPSATMPLFSDPEERIGAEVTQSFASILLSKLGDSAEDISSRFGTPLLNIYRSINKNWGSTPKFNDTSDCNSIFNFLIQELEHQGGARFLLPIGINDIVIPIYDDEPTSIISFALVSPDYHSQLSEEPERMKDVTESSLSMPFYEAENFISQSFDEISFDPFRSFGSSEDSTLSLSGSRGSQAMDPLTYTKSMHARVSFMDEGPGGKIKYSVTCYYAKCFDTLRRSCCPSEVDFIQSLSRCKKWGAQGGKSNVFFAKSLDDRFIIKQVTKTELESFIKFAPKYFKYLSDSITTGSPTCLAKILGIYQVTSKSLRGGKDLKMDVLVMENLLFRRNITRLYDLKGSSRSRYNPDSSGNNKVLLDQNLIEAMPTSPIFVGNKAKRLLERAVWNDTSFLASIDVMDYSLLVGIDEENHELVLGIIDFMRQYTWDKHLETWVKASGILGGPKNVSPTVISPKQYKRRFRKAMSAYFLVVPDQWSSSANVPNKLQAEDFENSQQDTSVKD